MSEVIDLDKLVPEPKKIKLNGKIIDLYPGKLKTIIKLQRAFSGLQMGNTDKIDDVITILSEIIPALKDDDMDIPLATLERLVQLAYETAMPQNNTNSAEAKMTLNDEKKTEMELKEPLPTSSESSQPTG